MSPLQSSRADRRYLEMNSETATRCAPARRLRSAARGLALGLATVLLPTATVVAQPEYTDRERCLLDRIRAAAPTATVAEIQADCEPPTATLPSATPEDDASRQSQLIAPLPPVPEPVAFGTTSSPVERRMLSESRLWGERFALLPHRPNYLMPLTHMSRDPVVGSQELQRNEIKFQLSFKFPLTPPLFEGRGALFFAYTGQFWWQAFNDDVSSPFRDYGHEPELFYAWRPGFSLAGWTARHASLGFVHQSNGRSGQISRSWNRLFAELTLDRPSGWWLSLRPWWRVPEDDDDDNPEITRFVGNGELRVGHVGETENWTLTLRRNLGSGGKGSAQLDWSRPTGFSPQLRWYVQYFDGYGESLIDYNRRLQRIGAGVMLNDWF